jgi:uncharacterized protein (DUF1330 family)
MAFERIMGIDVIDQQEYQRYREAMAPILKAFGGSFGYDFTVSEVLRSKTDNHINRVFTLAFANQEAMESFFSDPDYLVVQQKHFNRSVKSKTVISLHQTTDF